jgi:hypothetical protein
MERVSDTRKDAWGRARVDQDADGGWLIDRCEGGTWTFDSINAFHLEKDSLDSAGLFFARQKVSGTHVVADDIPT